MARIDPDYDPDVERDRHTEEERRRRQQPTTPTPTSGSDGKPQGPGRTYTAEEQDWLRRNPGDEHRMAEALRNLTFSAGGSGGDADINADRRSDAGWYRTAGGQWVRGMPPPPTNLGPTNDPRLAPVFHGTFNDPLTAQYEKLLQSQLAMQQSNQAALQQWLNPLIQEQQQLIAAQRAQYAAQQKALEDEAARAAQKRAATQAAVDRLTGYLNERMTTLKQAPPELERLGSDIQQRVTRLQGPAYTPLEQEILRTQLLDPLERDRTAAQKRALEQISSRGFELDSGVAQELLRQVDRAFEEERTRQQSGLSARQIAEQRSREQEAQGLLQYLAELQLQDRRAREQESGQILQYLAALPEAVARGDLEYVTYVQNLLNQPRQASIATGQAGATGVANLYDLPTQPGMQALGIAETLADLPAKRLNEALATLGIAPSATGATSSLIQLLQAAQQQRAYQNANAANYWLNIGRSFQP